MKPEQLKGEHGTTETVRVKTDNEDGYAVINKADFDAGQHEVVEESAPAKSKRGK